jgi:hypothetical protein
MGNYDYNAPWAGFGSWQDYLNSLGENPWAYDNPTPPEDVPADFFDPVEDPNDFGPKNTDWLWGADPYAPNPGPEPTPDPVIFGDPDMLIPVDEGPEVIGGWGTYPNGQQGIYDKTPPAGSPGITHPNTDLLGLGNPTVYPPGGIFGTGVDFGIPGIASIGGVAQAAGLGGLLGMDQPGKGLGGPVGIDTGGSGGLIGLGSGGGLLGLGGAIGLGVLGGGNGAGASSSGPQPYPGPQPNYPVQSGPAVTFPPVFGNDSGSGGYDPAPVASGGQSQTPTTLPPIIGTPEVVQPAQPTTTPAPVATGGQTQPPTTIPTAPIFGTPAGVEPTQPTTVPSLFPGPQPDVPVVGPSVTFPAIPTQTAPPTTVPVIPATPSAPGGSGPNTIPMPTIPTPLDRNYYREGNQTTQDFGLLGPGIFNNYAQYAGQYGNADFNNYAGLLGGTAGTNRQLTGLANEQTAAGNTSLRTNNLTDAQNLSPAALGLLRELNPNMYGSLDAANSAAGSVGPSDIQQTLEGQARAGLALGGSLSDEEMRRAQQAARTAWSARGLVNSKGAIGAEILNTDMLSRQRQQERQALAQSVDAAGYGQRQGAFGSQVTNAGLQAANRFDPFATITSQNTQNQGSNQALFGNTAAFSSGAMGNANVNSLVNPFNQYANDVYGSNFNAANARSIAAGNNAAALAGARDANSGALANAFLNFAGTYFGGG